jgi:hypothetical protein
LGLWITNAPSAGEPAELPAMATIAVVPEALHERAAG